MMIDAHAHGKIAELEGDPKAYVAAWRERGVEAIVLIEPLDDCLAAREKCGDFIIPCARINMDDSSGKEIEECIAAGCPAIKFIRPAAPYSDERYWPLYAKLEELGKTAVFHTGYLGFGKGKREDRPVHMEYMRAAQIDVISRRFPDMRILMSHFSNPWWEEAWKIMWTKPNVYADLSGGTAINRSLLMWSEMFAPNGELMEDSIRKLLYAADTFFFRPRQTAERWHPKHVAFHEKLYDRIGLSDELRELVNRGNARMLFGLDET